MILKILFKHKYWFIEEIHTKTDVFLFRCIRLSGHMLNCIRRLPKDIVTTETCHETQTSALFSLSLSLYSIPQSARIYYFWNLFRYHKGKVHGKIGYRSKNVKFLQLWNRSHYYPAIGLSSQLIIIKCKANTKIVFLNSRIKNMICIYKFG